MAKTTSIFNVTGQRLDDDPTPILYIGPTKSNVLNVIEPKLDEMLRLTPDLWAKTVKGKKYTRVKKLIGGVSFRFAWAGSPVELAADPAGLELVDEVDRMEDDIKGEGNVIELADARHSSFPDGKTIATSTPTEGNIETYEHPDTKLEHWLRAEADQVRSAIWVLWQDGTAHEWSWPCPDCREYFIPRFKLLTWESGTTAAVANKSARLTCPHCGSAIESKHKAWMNERGVFVMPGQRPLPHRDSDEVAHVADYTGKAPPELKPGGRGVIEVEFGGFELTEAAFDVTDVSFMISGIANFGTKKTFGYQAARYVRAVRSGDEQKIKGVINTEFGECFKFGGDAPPWQSVLACSDDYLEGDVADGVVLVFCTVDVQVDRLVYVVRGFGAAEESWLIQKGELWGPTDRPGTDEIPGAWEQLDELAMSRFNGLRISRGLVDSGFRKDQVYAFCRKRRRVWFPTKGQDSPARPFWASPQDVNYQGRVIKKGILLWNFDHDFFKSWVHSRVEWPADQPGGWHLPSDITDDYCRQIVGEQRLLLPSGRVTWKRVGQNHYLDCEALQPLALRTLGPNVINRLIRRRSKADEQAEMEEEEETKPAKKKGRRRRSSFVRDW